jgi:hypothetical protein
MTNRILARAQAIARRNPIDPPMSHEVLTAIGISLLIIAAALATLSAIGEVIVGMTP